MPIAPEYEALLSELAAQEGPKLSDLSAAEGREMYRLMRPRNDAPPVGDVADRTVPGSAGPIPVRIYTPAGAGPFGILVYYHGGGWVIGDLDTADGVCRNLCQAADCIVVSVDYRLAPEHLYPAAVEDAWSALSWVAEHGRTLGGSGRLGVCGESAGGNLAAVVAQKAREAGAPELHLQLLAYPVVDHDLDRQSYRDNGEGYLLETEGMVYFWDQYCPDQERRNEPAASPLRAESLAGLAPALVVTAEFDPLRDEGRAYADAIAAAGGQAELICFDGLIHDFLATAEAFECSRAAFDEVASRLRAALS